MTNEMTILISAPLGGGPADGFQNAMRQMRADYLMVTRGLDSMGVDGISGVSSSGALHRTVLAIPDGYSEAQVLQRVLDICEVHYGLDGFFLERVGARL